MKTLICDSIELTNISRSRLFDLISSVSDNMSIEKIAEIAYYLQGKVDAEELPEDTYFITDLIGIEVYTEENELLGNITDIFPTGSNDVYVIRNEIGKQILIPAISSVVKDVDINNKKIVVELIEGLI